MTKQAMDDAELACRTFLERLQAVKDDRQNWPDYSNAADTSYPIVGNKKTGALRRQSLELTRALAELRKS